MRLTPFGRRGLTALLLAAALASCAETSAPSPPAEPLLLVLDQGGPSLSILPLPSLSSSVQLALGAGVGPASLATRGAVALVSFSQSDNVAAIDLRARTVARWIPLPAGAGASGLTLMDDSIAFVANTSLGSITRINYLSGDTTEIVVGGNPLGAEFTRGRLFVLNGINPPGGGVGAAWATVIDPVSNERSEGIDSIALPGPGYARYAAVAADGLLYIMNRGDTTSGVGRLSIVDPVQRSELASFGGLGTAPGNLAAGIRDRLLISSLTEGVMEFDTRDRRVVRGAGAGVRIAENSFVAVDPDSRVYALERGDCAASAGVLHVLRPDLSELSARPLPGCPIAVQVALLPPP